ncbi:MAG: hypothetical protein CMC96_09330 [Flavobacteriales bacterium]|nr:hypothetical protein [Flavobacteriales bacterium]|tara:strand:- start:297 stop:479 length:183 start_codon:yes stop_codon:yes gene_type:complete
MVIMENMFLIYFVWATFIVLMVAMLGEKKGDRVCKTAKMLLTLIPFSALFRALKNLRKKE